MRTETGHSVKALINIFYGMTLVRDGVPKEPHELVGQFLELLDDEGYEIVSKAQMEQLWKKFVS